MIIEPSEGVVLVELAGNFGVVTMTEKSYDSLTSGKVIAVNPNDKGNAYLLGRTEYHRAYKDDCRIPNHDDPKLALIEVKDILGSSYESTDSQT
jgi:hypothetical protein